MGNLLYAKGDDGFYHWYEVEKSPAPEGVAPFVHGDTMRQALRHPVTGEVVDSMTRWNQINRAERLEIVGNELLSNKPRRVEDKITESLILDRIEKAEAISSDPARLRARRNEERMKTERHQRRMNGN